jgi:hypothetical protein
MAAITARIMGGDFGQLRHCKPHTARWMWSNFDRTYTLYSVEWKCDKLERERRKYSCDRITVFACMDWGWPSVYRGTFIQCGSRIHIRSVTVWTFSLYDSNFCCVWLRRVSITTCANGIRVFNIRTNGSLVAHTHTHTALFYVVNTFTGLITKPNNFLHLSPPVHFTISF